MKSPHDYFGEYRAADKRRRRGYRRSQGCDCPECFPDHDVVEAAYWDKREKLKRMRGEVP